jgi:hypothetical protein
MLPQAYKKKQMECWRELCEPQFPCTQKVAFEVVAVTRELPGAFELSPSSDCEGACCNIWLVLRVSHEQTSGGRDR